MHDAFCWEPSYLYLQAAGVGTEAGPEAQRAANPGWDSRDLVQADMEPETEGS